MIERSVIADIVNGYDLEDVKIGMIASHSALDVCDGAVEEGFRTIAVCQKGREKTYADYFRAQRFDDGEIRRGFIDDPWVLDKFSDILSSENQIRLADGNVVFIPNRSFTSYCDLTAIEEEFRVPMMGSRNMLRSEERGEQQDYYWLLEKAGLPFPEKLEKPEDISELSVIKLHHAQKKLERGFFTASSYDEYKVK